MKWSAWAALAAPFALLLLILATVVMLPRSQTGSYRTSIAPTPAANVSPTVVNLPAIVVTPTSARLTRTQSSQDPQSISWLHTASIDSSPSNLYRWGSTQVNLRMPYYSFGNSMLVSPKD